MSRNRSIVKDSQSSPLPDIRAAIEDYRQQTDDDSDGASWWGVINRGEATRQFATRMDEILHVAKARMLREAEVGVSAPKKSEYPP